jgi:hypothetical protein
MSLNLCYEITSFMDQRSIAHCLSKKGLTAKEIHQELVRKLGTGAVVYPTVMWYLHAVKFSAQSKEAPDEVGVTQTDSVDAAILKALTENPFSSMSKSSPLTCLSRSTVHRYLTESLGFAVRHLHWISHRPSEDDRDRLVSRAPASAAKAANAPVAQHLGSG